MGLTNSSTGKSVNETNFIIKKKNKNDKIIAIAGNPNVGKSTLFNALTGMNQHTGNWPGKTVSNAQGYCETEKNSYILVDIPGTYSLYANSPEEEIARNFISFGDADAVIVVCDATCLERSLNLVFQIMEIKTPVIVCVNLIDEAKKKGIEIDLEALSKELGVRVVGTVARKKKSLKKLLCEIDNLQFGNSGNFKVQYPEIIEDGIKIIEESLRNREIGINKRWAAVKLLEGDKSLLKELENYSYENFENDEEIIFATKKAAHYIEKCGLKREKIRRMNAATIVKNAEETAQKVISYSKKSYAEKDRKIDRILTNKKFGYLVMILLLGVIFWITVSGANYVSEALSFLFSKLEWLIINILNFIGSPPLINSILIDGVYKVTSWVVSVMLPPMAIFFPLFTLLEDAGYLPRVAYNLDKPFKNCGSCGKQALTMCMGFGCNAAGVVGCRIIDSPRERILATVTNSLVPCNGRFPTIIAVISMFFITASGAGATFLSALILTVVILLGIGMTFLSTKILSSTFLKGERSSYTLEMPPYRRPQVLSVIVRSMFDRTLFVLGRSLSVAVPAGVIIWIMANVTVGGDTLLKHCADFLDPFAQLMGLDGVILIAFILGFPANEIVIPIIIMAYLSKGSLTELSSLEQMRELFISNGWNTVTAINVIIFMLFHWPCSTTVLTIKKETGSFKWALLSVLLPTVLGIMLCILIKFTFSLF